LPWRRYFLWRTLRDGRKAPILCGTHMKILRKSSLESAPWKDGGGTTQEVVRVPATGEEFAWRLSLATIDSSGSFADFTGYTRTMLFLEGDGVRLKFLGTHERVLNRIGEMFEFDGSIAVDCELLGGACTDMNLITAHKIGTISAAVHELGKPLLIPETLSETLLLFAVSGTVVVEGGRGQLEIMENWDTVICAPSDATVTCRTAAHSMEAAVVFMARIAEPAP
jgi:uncharacterized protein